MSVGDWVLYDSDLTLSPPHLGGCSWTSSAFRVYFPHLAIYGVPLFGLFVDGETKRISCQVVVVLPSPLTASDNNVICVEDRVINVPPSTIACSHL